MVGRASYCRPHGISRWSSLHRRHMRHSPLAGRCRIRPQWAGSSRPPSRCGQPSPGSGPKRPSAQLSNWRAETAYVQDSPSRAQPQYSKALRPFAAAGAEIRWACRIRQCPDLRLRPAHATVLVPGATCILRPPKLEQADVPAALAEATADTSANGPLRSVNVRRRVRIRYDHDPGSHRHPIVKIDHILVQQADTPGGNRVADAPGLISPMQPI